MDSMETEEEEEEEEREGGLELDVRDKRKGERKIYHTHD